MIKLCVFEGAWEEISKRVGGSVGGLQSLGAGNSSMVHASASGRPPDVALGRTILPGLLLRRCILRN